MGDRGEWYPIPSEAQDWRGSLPCECGETMAWYGGDEETRPGWYCAACGRQSLLERPPHPDDPG